MAIHLEPEQLALFEELLEAWRSVPRDRRTSFLYVKTMGGNIVQGNGMNRYVADGDIETISSEGLITFEGDAFSISPRQITHYQEWKAANVEPVADVEDQLHRYRDSEHFRNRYREAYARWKDAAELLWGEDSEQELSTIGHKCREAMQEFSTALLDLWRAGCEPRQGENAGSVLGCREQSACRPWRAQV